MITNSNFYSKA